MDTALQRFASANKGFAQFVDRYEYVAANPEARAAFRKWEINRNMDLREIQLQRVESKAEMIIGMLKDQEPEDVVWRSAQRAGFTREQFEKFKLEAKAK